MQTITKTIPVKTTTKTSYNAKLKRPDGSIREQKYLSLERAIEASNYFLSQGMTFIEITETTVQQIEVR